MRIRGARFVEAHAVVEFGTDNLGSARLFLTSLVFKNALHKLVVPAGHLA